jgi:hypothetical protein
VQVADRWHLLKNVGDALERDLLLMADEYRPAAMTVRRHTRTYERSQVTRRTFSAGPWRSPRSPVPSRRCAQYDRVGAFRLGRV